MMTLNFKGFWLSILFNPRISHTDALYSTSSVFILRFHQECYFRDGLLTAVNLQSVNYKQVFSVDTNLCSNVAKLILLLTWCYVTINIHGVL